MTDPDEALHYLIERFLRKAELTPGGHPGPGDASLDTLHELVAAKLGVDPALPRLEAAMARLRMALRAATDKDPAFAADLSAALARVRWGSDGFDQGYGGLPSPGGDPNGGSYPAGGQQGYGQPGYAVEDVWVEEREQQDPPDPSGWSPRT